MTFEEFFRKKKIDLVALQTAQPGLFSEFKEHYEAMGEKSFDHTKKYWFNKLRLQYHLVPEVKEDKVVIENRLAEQTIVESLTEPAATNVGFKPRFKAGATTAKPTETEPEPVVKAEEPKETAASSDTETSAAPKPAGFKPRFNAKAMAPKVEEPVAEDKPATEVPAETTAAPKPTGFKPRFNAAKMTAKKDEPVDEEKPVEENLTQIEASAETPTASKPAGFKPRFNAAKMVPKKGEPVAEEIHVEEGPAATAAPVEQKAEDNKAKEQEANPAAEDSPKLGFKPRFNPKTTKPQQPKTEE